MKKRLIYCVIILAFTVVLMGLCFNNRFYKHTINNPFNIRVTELRIYDDYSSEESTTKDGKRLPITVDIENKTEERFKDVSYVLELNPEVKPYIACGELRFESDKMDVYTKKEAKETEAYVWGFEHEWGTLLTTEEDLEEYSSTEQKKIVENLNELTVYVEWRGGKQVEKIPLELLEENISL